MSRPRARATVVIADDHAVVRSGVRALLEAEPEFEVTGEAADVGTALTYVRAQRPSLLVLDLHMPGELSMPSIPRFLEASGETAIVVLTSDGEPVFVREALRLGATGYVLKGAARGELVRGVRAALSGQTYLEPQLTAQLAATLPSPTVSRNDLSERESGVLKLIALGYTNVEIAARLFLSVRTIESHRAHIQQKLQLDTRAQLVRYALTRGYVDLAAALEGD